MSMRRITYPDGSSTANLRCDCTGCRGCVDCEDTFTVQFMPSHDVRERASWRGWTRRHRRDYCPECST